MRIILLEPMEDEAGRMIDNLEKYHDHPLYLAQLDLNYKLNQ